MKRVFLLLTAVLLVAVSAFAGEPRLRLATTTSTENSGLLAELIPPFETAQGCKVDVIAVGTGKAMKLGEGGDVDVILVHARSREDAFVEQGYGMGRRDVMYNDFVIVGPENDPAGVSGMKDAAAALKKIAESESVFVSRGDDSGTHIMEKSIWKSAGLVPSGAWYLEAGRGMGEVITMAEERRGYALCDRGTFVAYSNRVGLKVAVEGDKTLFNPYGVIAVSPEKHPHVQKALALAFCEYLVSEKAQAIIAGYRRNGQQLFFTYE